MQPSDDPTDTPRIAFHGHRMDAGDAPRNLRDATIVIAGASSGMGLATALAFARHGANIVLAARRAGTGLRSGWGATERCRKRGTTLGMAVAAVSAVACLVRHAGRRRTAAQAAAPRLSRRW